ncbi:VWA domain-containing protein [Burkholderia sp. 22PA0106]|uniref:TadE/TadG family type IV pilus assembly protein n=1 Tax=Burkholderia sp. 22PA0106 TaxID=3237371 RepID=UPI0039C0B84E
MRADLSSPDATDRDPGDFAAGSSVVPPVAPTAISAATAWMIDPTAANRRRPRSLRGFWRQDDGAFTMMFAILGSILVGTLCFAIDSIEYVMSQTQMQMALDVAALSSGADLTHYSDTTGQNYTQWQADAYAYFQGNQPPTSYLGLRGAQFTATMTGTPSTGQTINLSASGRLPLLAPYFLDPTVSKAAATGGGGSSTGSPQTAFLSAVNTVLRQPKSLLELALVLDNTGSMSQSADGTANGASKMSGLKSAANSLINSLYSSGNATYYVGLVPFASTVNLTGALSGGGSWMNPVFTYNSANVSMTANRSISGSGWGGCAVEPRDGNNNLSPSVYSPSTSPKFTPYYYNVPPSTGLTVRTWFSGNLCSTGRGTSSSTSTGNNLPLTVTTAGYSVQNWCTSPQGIGIGTEVDQYDPNSYGSQTVTQNSQCMGQSVTFLTNQQATLTNGINNMVAGGSTIIPMGLLWGWRMLTSSWSQNVAGAANGWISTDPSLPKPENTQSLQRVMIVLTDGENQIGAAGSFPNTLWFNGLSGVGTNSLKASSVLRTDGTTLANGQTDSAELHGNNPIDASSGNNAGYPDDVNTFQNAVCTAIKNSGVTIYTITFGSDASNSVAQTAMRNCASPGNYYHAPDNTSLNTIFQQIAGSLGTLRLTR